MPTVYAQNTDQAGKATKIDWSIHDGKHVPKKNVPWKDTIESTKRGPAKYKWRDLKKQEQLEREAWEKGIPTNDDNPHKVIKFDHIIGAHDGQETQYAIVKSTNNGSVIHGHPISHEKFIELTKGK